MRKQVIPCRTASLLMCRYTFVKRFRNIKNLSSCVCIISRFLRPSGSFPPSKFRRVRFAIVDIETTGGYAAANGIIEISIQVFDGESVVETFETLVNPGRPIPRYIRA